MALQCSQVFNSGRIINVVRVSGSLGTGPYYRDLDN